MLGRTDSPRRLLALLVGLVVLAGSLTLRLSWWQIAQHDVLAAEARAQTTLRLQIPAQRGDIYDRTGTVVLATTVDHYRLSAAPNMLSAAQIPDEADRLISILGLDAAGAKTLRDGLASNRPYVVLATGLDEATAQQIRTDLADGKLSELSLETEPVRVYPQPGGGPDTSLASQLLGFVNADGVGQYGVEQYYQDVLGGQAETIVAQKDANGRPVPDTETVVDPGVPGNDITLTIDASLQLAVEQELVATYAADQAKSVSAVVMDPRTGEIYAEASYPAYDANQYQQVANQDASRFMDPVISSVYEPGSVFKMLTAVAALSSGTVGLKTLVNDSGVLKLDHGKTKVSDADHIAMGWIPFEDIVAWSRNVGASRVALKLGPTTRDAAVALEDTWTRFGFGRPTGVDLAGEVGGIVRDPTITPWRQIDLANGSFGQGVAVTPLQLAVAYSAMINGGTLVHPHVVSTIGGQEVPTTPQATGLVSASLSAQLTALMHHVVATVPFYRDRTLVPGYVVGGKTGTAQIWDPSLNDGRGAFKKNLFNYSFVGYIGRSEPELMVAVRIEEARPTVARVGEIELPVMSFELFRRVATNAITMLDLPRPAPPQLAPSRPGASPAASPAGSAP